MANVVLGSRLDLGAIAPRGEPLDRIGVIFVIAIGVLPFDWLAEPRRSASRTEPSRGNLKNFAVSFANRPEAARLHRQNHEPQPAPRVR